MTHPARAPDPGWMPFSPCSDCCTQTGNHTGGLRAVCRGVAFAAVLVAVAATTPLLLLLTSRARARWLQVASRVMLGALGVQIRVHGPRRFGDAGVLVVANHLSWIEILALSIVQPVRLIAKGEVRRWFLVGAIATATGALFIDRRGLRALPETVADIAAALRAGHAVAVFPEGTTWCGAAAGPFRRAAFQAALDARVPVRPVAVTLRRGGQVAPEAAFVGEQGLLASVVRVLRLSRLVCDLTLMPTIPPGGNRAELASRAGSAITTTTGILHPSRGQVHLPAVWRTTDGVRYSWSGDNHRAGDRAQVRVG